jgi:hypothetical protein
LRISFLTGLASHKGNQIEDFLFVWLVLICLERRVADKPDKQGKSSLSTGEFGTSLF